MQHLATFKEPVKGLDISLCLFSLGELEPSPFQRAMSTSLVRDLGLSIAHAFLCPLIVTESDTDGVYYVIDGQHRLESLRSTVLDPIGIPGLIIPQTFSTKPLLYNIEKADNIRDKCTKLHNLYKYFYANSPDEMENEVLRAGIGKDSHLVPIAFAYTEQALSSPSLVESAVKKIAPSYLAMPFSASWSERQRQGMLVARLGSTVDQIAIDYGIRDYNLKKAILSKTVSSMWGRVQRVDIPFEEGIEELISLMQGTDWSWMARG